jgi:hypothetical protein
MQKLALTLAFLVGLVTLAVGQAPPPVPALPDAQRLTSYTLTASTCSCSVGFAIYGDGADVDAWVQVFINAVPYLSTDPAHGWSLTSASGSLGNIARPITNAVLTFAMPQTGAVAIVGDRRPRRVSQFPENRGVTARDLNQVITDIVSQNRESWDKLNAVAASSGGGGTGGAIFLTPNTWAAPQTFTAGIATSSITTGSSNILQLQVGNTVNSSGTPINANLTPTFDNFFVRTLIGDIFGSASWPFSHEVSQPMMFVVDPYGTGAQTLAMRTSDWPAIYPPLGSANVPQVVTSTILTVHDKTTSGVTAVWGQYSQLERTASALTAVPALQMEMSFSNLGSSVVTTPINVNGGGSAYTIVLRLDAGLGLGSASPPVSTTPISAAIDIVNNGGCTPVANCGQMYTAMNIGHDAIAAVSGHLRAIMMPENYEIDWFHSDNSLNAFIKADTTGEMILQGNGAQFNMSGPIFVTGSSYQFAFNFGTTILDYAVATPSVWTFGAPIILPTAAVTTGTPVASLCLDASNKIIKKTTAGSCI